MHRCIALIATITILCATTQAQVPPPPVGFGPAPSPLGDAKPAKASKEDSEKAAAAAASTEGIVPLSGDTIVFKNGSRLEGVKIASESPVGVEVKVTDADTLLIPRKQIDHIEYGESAESAAAAADTGPSILKGQKVSNELFQKLTAPVPDANLEVKEEDFVESLNKLAKKLDVTIEITDPVKAMSAKDRGWSIKLDSGTTLATYLENGLLKTFPTLKVEFPNDRIVISVKDSSDTQ